MAFSFLPSKSNSIQHKSVMVFWLLSIWCLEPETGGDVEVVGITCVAGCKIDITLTSYWFVAGGDWPGLIFSLICRELVRDGGTSGGEGGVVGGEGELSIIIIRRLSSVFPPDLLSWWLRPCGVWGMSQFLCYVEADIEAAGSDLLVGRDGTK